MVHMVAVVLGSLPHSNHLWYHMFAPEELTDTHITGFMVRKSFLMIIGAAQDYCPYCIEGVSM